LLLSDQEDASAAVAVVDAAADVDVEVVVVDVADANVVVVVDFFPSSSNLIYELIHLLHFFDVAAFAFPTIVFVKLFAPH